MRLLPVTFHLLRCIVPRALHFVFYILCFAYFAAVPVIPAFAAAFATTLPVPNTLPIPCSCLCLHPHRHPIYSLFDHGSAFCPFTAFLHFICPYLFAVTCLTFTAVLPLPALPLTALPSFAFTPTYPTTCTSIICIAIYLAHYLCCVYALPLLYNLSFSFSFYFFCSILYSITIMCFHFYTPVILFLPTCIPHGGFSRGSSCRTRPHSPWFSWLLVSLFFVFAPLMVPRSFCSHAVPPVSCWFAFSCRLDLFPFFFYVLLRLMLFLIPIPLARFLLTYICC